MDFDTLSAFVNDDCLLQARKVHPPIAGRSRSVEDLPRSPAKVLAQRKVKKINSAQANHLCCSCCCGVGVVLAMVMARYEMEWNVEERKKEF